MSRDRFNEFFVDQNHSILDHLSHRRKSKRCKMFNRFRYISSFIKQWTYARNLNAFSSEKKQAIMRLSDGFVVSFSTFLSLACFYFEICTANYSITSSQFIQDPEYITSSDSVFKLGFFSPVNSSNRYVGIWYNHIKVTTPVWVANRDKPLKDSSGVVKIFEDGNLVVLNGRQEILWTSNVSNGANTSTAFLSDDGNIVLQLGTDGNTIWQSFQHPSDTMLQNMKLTANEKTGENVRITSWTSPSDPSIGNFSAGIDPSNLPQLCVWKDDHLIWRSGPWTGQTYIGVPGMNSVYVLGFAVSLVKDEDETSSMSYTYQNDSWLYSSFVLDFEGKFRERYTKPGMEEGWEYSKWEAPMTECDVYGKCGEFGICNAQNSLICSCLTGFDPKVADEWKRGNWTGGCVRRTQLQCEKVDNSSEEGKDDGFLRMKTVKVPDFAHWSQASSGQDCNYACLNNCSCIAYSYYDGIGCMLWTESLIDVQEFSSGGTDLYIRLAYSELDKKSNMKVIISVMVIIGTIIIAVCACFLRRYMTKHRGNKHISEVVLLSDSSGAHPSKEEGNKSGNEVYQVQFRELPLFKLQQLETATDNFNESNELGKGGFGPVHKGKLPNGQEIAVKRLSSASGQGPEQFINEVEVISKLQHRNLVRLLGCCTEGDEKMLVYEYMPNKSLDAFLFDPQKRVLLDWRKRFNIIEGICRGLLYLHRDSRLKIIHRDLKPSNILLDQELAPKISDFGMAKIFGGNEDQANTRRVAGTYGYMSPEYAIEGRFSDKSDVFSFGVVLLETVSGRRNASFSDDEQGLNLLGFAWKLWNEGQEATLVDPDINDPRYLEEISRCIHIGLLCVQELAKERPSVSVVMSMLNSEIQDLPAPNHPAFLYRSFGQCTNSSEQSEKRGSNSINNMTHTVVEGR